MNRNFERGNSRKTGKRGLRKFWKVCAWGLSISMILGAGNVGSYIVTADDGEAQTAEIPAETSEPETETSEEPVFSVSPESTPSPEAAGYTVTEMTPAPTESTQPSESPVETAAPEPSAISTISPETAAPEPSAESTVLPETAEPVSSPVTTEAPASMPEMSFEQKEKTTGITVSVKAEAGTFPEGTTMELSPVEDPSILEDAKQASELQNPSAVAVDITFRNTDGTVIEPQKQIRVTMTSEVIRQAESVDVVHVPDQEEDTSTAVVDQVPDQNLSEEEKPAVDQVVFDADQFSVYAIVYTVDFTFSGYTYSIEGGSSILLSSLASQLGLHDSEQDKDFDINEVADASFSNPSLVSIEKQDNDYALTSLQSFTSAETLTIYMNDGSKYLVDVTDAQVNQGTTCEAYFLDDKGNRVSDASTLSGEELNARIRLTNSSANTGDYSYVKVGIEGLGTAVTLKNQIKNEPWDTITIEDSNTHQSFEIGVYFDQRSQSVIYRVPAGATAIVPLDFRTENGITPDGTRVILTPSKCDEYGNTVTPSDNDKIGNAATGTWNSTFKWDPISKKVNGQDGNTISIDDSVPDKPVLTGDLLYTYSANTGNAKTSGVRWTASATVSDQISLPDGVTLPEGYQIDNTTGKIMTSSGETIWQLDLKENMKVSEIQISSDRKTISYTLDITNPNKDSSGKLTGEMENISWSGTLSANQLTLASDYINKVQQNNGGKINNHVSIKEYPVVGSEKPESEDTVSTEPKYTSYQIDKTSNKEGKDLKPGDQIEYEIKVTNKSAEDITGDDSVITDNLPKALTLSNEEISRLDKIQGVNVIQNNDGTYTIRYKTDIPANSFVSLKVNATVKDIKQLKKDNVVSDQVTNTATYKDVSSTVINHFDNGYLTVTKTGNNIEWGQPKPTKNGETVIFTVTVKNDTNYSADKEYTLTDTLPAYLQLKVYRDETCKNQIPMEELYAGAINPQEDVYVKDISGSGHLVHVSINKENGEATLSKVFHYEDGFPANTAEEFGYEVVFNAAKVSNLNGDKVYYTNVAKLDDGTQGESGFSGQMGAISLSKDVTAAELNGKSVSEPYDDNTIVSYQIHVENDKDNPAAGDIIVNDDLPAGLMPYGLKDANGAEVTDFDQLAQYAEKSAVLKDEAGRDVIISYPETAGIKHFRLTWTFSNSDGKFDKIDITYRAQVKKDHISNMNGETVTLTNTASSRNKSVSKDIKVKGNGISIVKRVRDDATGEWVKSIKVKPNTSYTYELIIHNPNKVNAVIKNIKDVLPFAGNASVLNKGYWVKGKTVTADSNGDFLTHAVDKNNYPYPYEINTGEILFSNVQIKSNEDKLVQEITLTWPDEDALADWYAKTSTNPGYSSSKNQFLADGMEDHVDHQPDTEKKYYLQKSVVALNYGNGSTTNGKEYFSKDKLEFVEYGVVFVNTGKSPLHLNQLTDILPKELEFYGLTPSEYDNRGKYPSNGQQISLAYQSDPIGGTNFILPKGYSVLNNTKVSSTIDKSQVTLTINDGNGVDLPAGKVIAFNIWCKVKKDASKNMQENAPITNAIRAEVDKDAKLNPVLITTTKTPYDELQNNGTCREIASGESKKTAESTVTIYPINLPIPGIQKTAMRYREKNPENAWSDWSDLPADHSKNIGSQCQIEWKIKLYNDGTIPIKNYTFRDKLNSKHKFVSATWKLGSSQNAPSEIKISSSELKEGNRQIYLGEWKAPSADYAIPAGDYAEITVKTEYTSAGFQGQLMNEAFFEPQGECDYNGVQRGQLEKNSTGDRYIGVSSGDYVNMYGDGATISYKQVTEEDTPSNTAFGYNVSSGNNFITISDKEDVVRYTTSVTNVSKSSLYAYTMIDTLPAPNDTGVVNNNDSRGSKFHINLAENPSFTIVLAGKDNSGNAKEISLGTDDYSLEYSDKTEFSSDDWEGKSYNAWTRDHPEKAKSFRIILDQAKVGEKLQKIIRATNAIVLPSNWSIKVSFLCVAGDDAAPGDIAWNSFGYRYAYLNDLSDSNSFLTSEPPKVGVKIPAQPVIKKSVEDLNGNILEADKNKKFTFKVYKGNVTREPSEKDPVDTFEIYQGGYYELKPKTKVNGVDQGIYEDGQTYTVIEDAAPGFETSRFEVSGVVKATNQNYCSFTYQRNSKFSIQVVNRQKKSFILPETGGSGTRRISAAGWIFLALGAFLMIRKLLMIRGAGEGGGSL